MRDSFFILIGMSDDIERGRVYEAAGRVGAVAGGWEAKSQAEKLYRRVKCYIALFVLIRTSNGVERGKGVRGRRPSRAFGGGGGEVQYINRNTI